jgi:DNA-binding NarL/FixJ family response regulator
VLELVVEGCTNREIADRFSLSVRTVETYRERLMRKLDIHTVAGLTRYAIASGLVKILEK